jgi:hypothetical protein
VRAEKHALKPYVSDMEPQKKRPAALPPIAERAPTRERKASELRCGCFMPKVWYERRDEHGT